ncbi:MAG: gas vesicle protein GvpN [Leptolyngbyaceae bacterium]|nr:gas vesicle protein GvpN [Leptolyngbyaceae bacterium]
MTTVLQARPRRFVSTPSVERIAARTLRYLQSGFSVHLRGPAGTGKTTLALHLADLLGRPIMLVFGDDEFRTSDLIGNQSGYTRKKVVDNFIHSVVKVEDELKQNWVDSRLTLACREGFTLVYDEFNRSRPEVNNVLLSALEEKLLVLPPSGNKSEYIRVHPQFRTIFTSNPEEYCGVHDTQDALLDRLITLNIPEPDEFTQQEILIQKVGISREHALLIVRLVKGFRLKTSAKQASGLRSCLMIAKVCQEHEIPIKPENIDFREVCHDVLSSRTNLSVPEATKLIWDLLNGLVTREPERMETLVFSESSGNNGVEKMESLAFPEQNHLIAADGVDADGGEEAIAQDDLEEAEALELDLSELKPSDTPNLEEEIPYEQEIYSYVQQSQGARVSEIEKALGVNRFEAVNALRSLAEKGILTQRQNRVYLAQGT